MKTYDSGILRGGIISSLRAARTEDNVGDDQITALMQHIDASLDQRLRPVHDSIAGMTRSIERVFDKLDDVRDQVTSAEKDVAYLRDRIEEDEAQLDRCQENCEKKMKAAKDDAEIKIRETGAASSSEARTKTMLKIAVAVLTVLLPITGWLAAKFFETL